MVQVPAVAPGHGPRQVQLELVAAEARLVDVARAELPQVPEVPLRLVGEDVARAELARLVADVTLEAFDVEDVRVRRRQRHGLRAREVAAVSYTHLTLPTKA